MWFTYAAGQIKAFIARDQVQAEKGSEKEGLRGGGENVQSVQGHVKGQSLCLLTACMNS